MSINAQNKDSIIYIFPDKVEVKFYEYIKKEKIDNYGFYMTNDSDQKFRVYIYKCDGINNNYWQINTNRYLIIKDKKYPLFFDYDTFFSTREPFEIGVYGKREGYILRSHPIFEGYSITFDKTGELLSEDWGIYYKTK